MRAARVLVPRALDDGEPAFLENRLQAGETRMQPKRTARRIAADLQHGGRWDRNRRAAADIERVQIRNHRAQRVVAARKVDDHEAARSRTLRAGDVAQERRGRERYGEGGDA